MEDRFAVSAIPRAGQACFSCRKQKRKCDKLLPACGSCRRGRKQCDYSPTKADDIAWLRERVELLEHSLSNSSTAGGWAATDTSSNSSRTRSPPSDIPSEVVATSYVMPSYQSSSSISLSSFPTAFFLDTSVFQRNVGVVPRSFVSVPQPLLSELGSASNIHEAADIHFHTTHIWLPIIWKRRLYQRISQPDFQPGPDLALLLACMKLNSELPSIDYHPVQTRLYAMCKHFLSTAEDAGLLSLEVLQAAILLATFEIGHSIYPAAYMTVGRCARLGQAIGLHDRKYAPQAIQKPSSWGEIEEMRRVWCAVLILDRYVILGSQGRPLSAGEFGVNEVLPCDTQCWDNGELTPSQPLFVTSATELRADAFARASQVVHLIGRVIGHRDDRTLDGPFRFTSAQQLHKTLDSLLKLLQKEFYSSPVAFSAPLAMAFSGKMALLDIYACAETNRGIGCPEETEMQAIAISEFEKTAIEVTHFAQSLQLLTDAHFTTVGPLLCDCFYQAAATASWFIKESGSQQMIESLSTLSDSLTRLNSRWRVAGDYLKMLEQVDTIVDR